jgi:hypothetical protein
MSLTDWRKLEPGSKIIAAYKGKVHTVNVLPPEEGGDAPRFQLAAKGKHPIHKSPSAAGREVMTLPNGDQVACNGNRFFTPADHADAEAVRASAARGPRKETTAAEKAKAKAKAAAAKKKAAAAKKKAAAAEAAKPMVADETDSDSH